MANPSRFPNGITIDAVGTLWGNSPLPDENYLPNYQNDFFTYVATDWTVVASGSGSTAVNVGSVNGGGSMLLTWGTSGSQANTMSVAPFRFGAAASGGNVGQFWFEGECIASATAATPNYQIGVIAGAATSPTSGVYFTKAAAATSFSLVLNNGGTSSTFTIPAALLTLVNASRFSLGFYYDGKPNPTLWVYSGEVLIGTLGNGLAGYNNPGSLGVAGANNLANLPANTIGVAPSFLVGTGGTLEIDYVGIACELTRG